MFNKKELYRVKTVDEAREITVQYLNIQKLANVIDFGLPEIDDRYHIRRVPLKTKTGANIGEIVINALDTIIDAAKTTASKLLEDRLLGRSSATPQKTSVPSVPMLSTLKNTIGLGDSEELLKETPNQSIDLVFTSPPYYNARPQYAEYLSYEDYLLKMRKIIQTRF